MFKRLETIAGILAACLLFILMMVTFIDVVGRDFFNRPLTGASELTEVTLAALVFLMLPSVAARQEHIVVDLIDILKSHFLAIVQQVLTAIVGVALFGIISWRLWILGGMATRYGDATPTLGIPLAGVIYTMAVLAGVSTLCFAALLFRRVSIPESAEMKSAELMSQADEDANEPAAGFAAAAKTVER